MAGGPSKASDGGGHQKGQGRTRAFEFSAPSPVLQGDLINTADKTKSHKNPSVMGFGVAGRVVCPEGIWSSPNFPSGGFSCSDLPGRACQLAFSPF